MLVVALVVLLTGCVSTNVERYPNANYSPVDPSSVSVFSDFPPQSYEIIGETEATGAPASNWGSVENGMRMKAAEIGGDAVVIIVQDTPFAGTLNKPGRVSGSTSTHGTSSGSFNAYGLGGGIYGHSTGSGNAYSTSNYTITPPASTTMYKKHAKGFVIKFVQRILPTALTSAARPRFVRDMNLPPVAVSKVDASALSSATFAWYHDPTGQSHPLPLPPEATATIQQKADSAAQTVKREIIDELEKNGYTVAGGASLFDNDDTSNARFLFGGVIKGQKLDVSGYPLANMTGKTRRTVEWQVYDKKEKLVIFKAECVGVGSVDFQAGQQYSATIDSFKLFLSDPELLEAMQNSLKTSSSEKK